MAKAILREDLPWPVLIGGNILFALAFLAVFVALALFGLVLGEPMDVGGRVVQRWWWLGRCWPLGQDGFTFAETSLPAPLAGGVLREGRPLSLLSTEQKLSEFIDNFGPFSRFFTKGRYWR